MNIEGWKYYNHAAIPTTSPHISPDTSPVDNGEIWELGSKKVKPFFAMWTTEFDCCQDTKWWYVIKDTPFDLKSINANRRYKITKGNQNFFVKYVDISCVENQNAMSNIAIEAFSTYPKSYRPNVTKEQYREQIRNWTSCVVYGAYSTIDGQLCGFLKLVSDGQCKHLDIQKVLPACEKYNINAALIYNMLIDNQDFLENGGYICDGSRNVAHETQFQDYLEKYFLFRKAYSHLNIVYRKGIGQIVHILYPFRTILKKLDSISIIHNVNGVLKMEEIRRNA